jgi:hypothetical protein
MPSELFLPQYTSVPSVGSWEDRALRSGLGACRRTGH